MKQAANLFIIAGMAILAGHTAGGAAPDYTDGVFIVNEDWYGHQNSTVNFLRPDDPDGAYWEYRVIQSNNPGKELGCTNQYGAIHDGRFFLIAKQEKDPGATIAGGRVTVADASTLKIIAQLELIDPSGRQCDGRGFVGIDSHKGYVTSSNGLWIFNLDTYQIEGQVKGSDNPNAGGSDDKPNTDPSGSLYHGQSGMAVYAEGKVFAAHQSQGLLVIDPEIDEVIDVISMNLIAEGSGIGSVVQSLDGNLWCSVAPNVNGMGFTSPYLLKVDPSTLETDIIDIPADIHAPANSWYAWTPDGFCASSRQNALYWNGGSSSWFSQSHVYKYDIDNEEFSEFINLEEQPDNWHIYGCSMRIHPATDELYMSLFHEFQDPTYKLVRYDTDGYPIAEYPMISNYWFPSIPVFPSDEKLDEIADIDAGMENISVGGGALSFYGMKGEKAAVYDISGRKVAEFTVATDQYHFDLSLTASGIYIARCGDRSFKFSI